MLQIFNSNDQPRSSALGKGSTSSNISDSAMVQLEPQTLVSQLRAETEQRIFLEGALELMPLGSVVEVTAEENNDSSIVANLLDLLNRSAGTQQVLLAKAFVSSCSDAVVFECSNCDLCSGSLLESDRLSWLLRNAQRPGRKRVRLSFDQEAIALPVKEGYWLVAIGSVDSVDMDRIDTLRSHNAPSSSSVRSYVRPPRSSLGW